MIQIAFCDDDQTVLDQLSALLEKYRAQRCVQIQCTVFHSPLDLLAYVVGAYFYQIKPIWEDSFFRLTDSVIAECRRADQRSLILRCKTGISRIDLDQLLYCEVLGRTAGCH